MGTRTRTRTRSGSTRRPCAAATTRRSRRARRARRALGLLALLASLTPAAAAQSVCLGYGDIGTWYESGDCSATICSDGTQPGVLEFKDAHGNVLSTVNMEAAGCLTVPTPSGTTSYDWKKKDPPPEIAELVAGLPGLPPAFVPGGALGLLHEAEGLGSVTLGCLDVQVLRNVPAIAYAFRVATHDFATADALVAPILAGGVGTPVPPGVTVGSFVTLVHDGKTATITSSLPDRFDELVVDVDGLVLADLEAGFGVEVQDAGRGWMTVVVELPVAAALPGQVVTLRQRARHDGEPVELILVP